MRIISMLMMGALLGTIMPYQQKQNRQLLLFGNSVAPETVLHQMQVLDSASTGITEREINIRVIPKGSALYQQYKVSPNEFAVVLVGKDGGEKYRTKKVLQPVELFAIIDAMPMRKAEMKRKEQ
ncbi:DUF4174 domain-containing protein [Flavihumibacter fluvii]|uniref:DUF4174 domain-containing protein n=1 Tax=Flavihumibacter fluvii TaxID=2838157 RepID=UPI001BDF150F|nr:DUF4174 domain-containing protein [Flavihumibacter fluvii]ULQ54690.1 DUF4174 domain-containing protein [Flavihumibacter fluvii]